MDGPGHLVVGKHVCHFRPVMSRHSNREESIVLAGLVRASRIKSGCPVWRSKFGQVGPNIKDKNAPARSRRDGEPVESEEKRERFGFHRSDILHARGYSIND